MSERVEALKAELERLYEYANSDEGLILTRATKADHKQAASIVAKMPLEPVLRAAATVVANLVGEQLVQQGLRPADYAQDEAVLTVLAKRLAKALTVPDKTFSSEVQAVLRGQG